MRGRTTRVTVQSRHYNKTEQIQKITVRDYNYYSVSQYALPNAKQHCIYEVFTAKVGTVAVTAVEGKIVRLGSEVRPITSSFD